MSKALQFPRSDGTQTKWPDKLDPMPIGGEVNYMRPIDYNESLSVRWRTSVGREVAKLLGYEGNWADHLRLQSIPLTNQISQTLRNTRFRISQRDIVSFSIIKVHQRVQGQILTFTVSNSTFLLLSPKCVSVS